MYVNEVTTRKGWQSPQKLSELLSYVACLLENGNRKKTEVSHY